MISKFYDTCSLLKRVEDLFEEGVGVYISSITLKELENIKTSSNKDVDIKYAARKLLHTLDENSDKYETVVFNEEDGYYHVGTVNGPLLLADMLSGTKWNNSTLYEVSIEGKCIGADGEDYNLLIEEYAVYASNSEIGYTPVTKELADALKMVYQSKTYQQLQDTDGDLYIQSASYVYELLLKELKR